MISLRFYLVYCFLGFKGCVSGRVFFFVDEGNLLDFMPSSCYLSLICFSAFCDFQDTNAGVNSNKDLPICDGISGTEVEQRLIEVVGTLSLEIHFNLKFKK